MNTSQERLKDFATFGTNLQHVVFWLSVRLYGHLNSVLYSVYSYNPNLKNPHII